MNKKLLAKINRALVNTKANCMATVTKEALQRRLTEELEWADADPDRWACLKLLTDLTERIRAAGIVTSPGYGYFTCSFLLYLAGITRVNPVEWNLPFSRFLHSFGPDTDLVLETGTGAITVVEKVLQGRDELIVETEPGSFQITFMDGCTNAPFQLHILEYSELDCFKRTIKDGWHPLDEATLRLFSLGSTDGSIWFETDRMREALTEFGPESMSDLVLLRAIFCPQRIGLLPELIQRKQDPNLIPSTGNVAADRILRDSYGFLVYQEQALMLQEIDFPVNKPFKYLALKGHEIARVTLSVEALWPLRHKSSLIR